MRDSIETDEFSHGVLPIPAASRIGAFVASGNIFGYDFIAGSHPETADQQVQLMFGHLRSVITAAGGSLEDILKITVHVRSDAVRGAVDSEWIKAFPDPASRPARQTMVNAAMPGNRLVQCDMLAIIDSSRS